MKGKLRTYFINLIFAFFGAVFAILIMGVLKYPNSIKVEETIGTLGTIIGLILARWSYDAHCRTHAA